MPKGEILNTSKNDQEAEKQTPAQTAEEKLNTLLSNWISGEIQLAFHLRSGEVLKGKLLYFARYEYVIQPEGDKPAVVIMKHAIDYVDRVPGKPEAGGKEALRRMKRG